MLHRHKATRRTQIRAGAVAGVMLLAGPSLAFAAPGQPSVASRPSRPPTAITPQAALVRVLTAPRLQADWFAPAFLAQVSVAQLQQGIAALKAQLGPYQGVTAQPNGSYLVRFGRGTVQAQIHLDGQGRIDGLRLTDVHFTYVSQGTALAGLKGLPGRVSVLVLANGAPRTAVDSAASLAVGSAFKLAVLAALNKRIAAHQLSWQQHITLHAADKSLPSGILQTKAAGSTYTISDVARYMISISDNTAANMLIRVVGRRAIGPLIPLRDRPILTTRELFILKAPANHDLVVRYLAASTPSQRLVVLDAADRRPLPSLRVLGPLLARGPVVPQIEYFFTVRQLCGLMGQVSQLPQMSVTTGVADPSEWTHVAFKGGSDAGVLNLTTLVQAHGGTTYCVSATWNNSATLDEGRFEQLYSSLLHSFH